MVHFRRTMSFAGRSLQLSFNWLILIRLFHRCQLVSSSWPTASSTTSSSYCPLSHWPSWLRPSVQLKRLSVRQVRLPLYLRSPSLSLVPFACKSSLSLAVFVDFIVLVTSNFVVKEDNSLIATCFRFLNYTKHTRSVLCLFSVSICLFVQTKCIHNVSFTDKAVANGSIDWKVKRFTL